MPNEQQFEVLNEYIRGHVLLKFTQSGHAIYVHPMALKVSIPQMRVQFLMTASTVAVYDAISIDSENDVIVLGELVATVDARERVQ